MVNLRWIGQRIWPSEACHFLEELGYQDKEHVPKCLISRLLSR